MRKIEIINQYDFGGKFSQNSNILKLQLHFLFFNLTVMNRIPINELQMRSGGVI